MRRIDTEEGFERVHAGIALTPHIQCTTPTDMILWHKDSDWKRLQDWITSHNLLWSPHTNVQNLPNEVAIHRQTL